MAGNNTNIWHVNAIQGLISEICRHLKALEPSKETANVFSEQTIAKENAEEWIKQFEVVDIHKLQQAFENE